MLFSIRVLTRHLVILCGLVTGLCSVSAHGQVDAASQTDDVSQRDPEPPADDVAREERATAGNETEVVGPRQQFAVRTTV